MDLTTFKSISSELRKLKGFADSPNLDEYKVMLQGIIQKAQWNQKHEDADRFKNILECLELLMAMRKVDLSHPKQNNVLDITKRLQ